MMPMVHLPSFKWHTHCIGNVAVSPTETSHRKELAHNVILSFIVYYFNVHDWTHRPSCFHTSARTRESRILSKRMCRYRFPRYVFNHLGIDEETGELCVRRAHGNEYVNPFSPVSSQVFLANNDARILAKLQRAEDTGDISFLSGTRIYTAITTFCLH